MYVKLFASILDSSLWVCDYPTRILFITMMAMADREGYIYASRSGLARRAMIDPDEISDALANLSAPDGDSSDALRNPDNQGRRIEQVSGGWRILNYSYYRDLRDADERREQNRVAQRNTRQRRSATVSNRQQPSAGVSLSESESSTATASESDSSTPRRKSSKEEVEGLDLDTELRMYARDHGVKDPTSLMETFKLHYRSNGYKVGRNPIKDARAAFMRWIRENKAKSASQKQLIAPLGDE